MELRDYLQALRHFWWVALACLLIGIMGALGYNRATFLDEAKTSVAVLSPLVSSKASGATEAQVSFDSIIKSNTLAALVAARVGESEKTVSEDLSVSVDSGSTGASVTSPLYIVHGKDHRLQQAEKLVNVAVEEASQLFVTINVTDGSDMKAALAKQREAIAGQVASAQSALDKYVADNNAADLPGRVQQQRARVDQLTLSVYAAEAVVQGDLHSYYPQSAQYSRDNNAYQTLSNGLIKERIEFDRLSGLLPRYIELQYQLTAAQTREQAFDIQSQNLLVNSILPAQVQVKVLDTASEESQVTFLLLTYGLGAVSGIILALAAIYVLAFVHRRPATVEEVARALGAPILVRIPRTAG